MVRWLLSLLVFNLWLGNPERNCPTGFLLEASEKMQEERGSLHACIHMQHAYLEFVCVPETEGERAREGDLFVGSSSNALCDAHSKLGKRDASFKCRSCLH